MSDSRLTIFGVVPDAIRAWKPDSAPHMMTMHTNGHTEPADRPAAVDEGRGGRHLQRRLGNEDPDRPAATITPIFMYGAEIIARAEQHPHRQDRDHRRVDRQDDRQLGLPKTR